MGLNVWYIFTSILLVSVEASRYDQGPQQFYDVSSDSAISEQKGNKEVILYLTTDQVRALEAGGAVVRQAEDPENDEPQIEPQVNEDQEDDEQDENKEAQEEEEEAQEEEQENPKDILNQNIDLEDILRILNEQQIEEEEATEEQASNEPQVEEENIEAPRNFSPRIMLRQQQQQEQRYSAPAVAKKEQILKSYSYIRYHNNEQPQRINVQLLQQQQEDASEAEESNEEPQTGLRLERNKYKLIPYEVEETPQEPAQEQIVEEKIQQNFEADDDAQRLNEIVTRLRGADRLTEAISQRKNRLLQNEPRIQTILRELKGSPKYNDQKYAIEIEKLRANVEEQNTQWRAEAIVKAAPDQIKQQLSKKRLLSKSAKKGKDQARDAEAQRAKPPQPKFRSNSASSENARSIPVPVIKVAKTEVQRPIPVLVETSKRVSVKNEYVRTRKDKPYIVSRKVPENRRQNPTEVPKSKPERITILRHIWEQ